MSVATISLFIVLAIIGGCNGVGLGEREVVDMTGYSYFMLGVGLTAFILWFGKWSEDAL